jgi:hypothetical protein
MDLRLVYKKATPHRVASGTNLIKRIKSNKGTNEWLLIARQSSSLGILHLPHPLL